MAKKSYTHKLAEKLAHKMARKMVSGLFRLLTGK